MVMYTYDTFPVSSKRREAYDELSFPESLLSQNSLRWKYIRRRYTHGAAVREVKSEGAGELASSSARLLSIASCVYLYVDMYYVSTYIVRVAVLYLTFL